MQCLIDKNDYNILVILTSLYVMNHSYESSSKVFKILEKSKGTLKAISKNIIIQYLDALEESGTLTESQKNLKLIFKGE